MKTTPRRPTALVQWFALVLAVLPAACYGANSNVRIQQAVYDRGGHTNVTIAIWPTTADLFLAYQQISDVGSNWQWSDAVINPSGTANGFSYASEPYFVNPGTYTVIATFNTVSSPGATITVVCPDIGTTPGSPICCVPDYCYGDPYYTNYVWGGTFNYAATYFDQNGVKQPALALWTKETQGEMSDDSTCVLPPAGDDPTWTVEPFAITGNTWTDYITNLSPDPPTPCFTTTYVPMYLGTSYYGPWKCAYVNTSTITVTEQFMAPLITTEDNNQTDVPCSY